MKTYYVKVAVRILETYKVEAEDKASPRTCGAKVFSSKPMTVLSDPEILSVKEA